MDETRRTCCAVHPEPSSCFELVVPKLSDGENSRQVKLHINYNALTWENAGKTCAYILDLLNEHRITVVRHVEVR
jgi:hypothetical protein